MSDGNQPFDVAARYYDVGGVSFIDILRAKLTPEQRVGYLLGNCLKYAVRLNFKGIKKRDAEKLATYAMELFETLEAEHNERGRIATDDK